MYQIIETVIFSRYVKDNLVTANILTQVERF